MSAALRFQYTVACPKCGAEKWAACKSPKGKWSAPHQSRADIPFEAWRIGYLDGLGSLLGRLDGLANEVEFIERNIREHAAREQEAIR